MSLLTIIRILAIVAVTESTSTHAALTPKALSGPPVEFAQMALPDPSAALVNSDKALFLISLAAGADGIPTFQQQIQVDSTTGFALSVFSPLAQQLQYSLVDPNGAVVPMTKSAPTFYPVSEDAELNKKIAGTFFEFDNPVLGVYTLTVSAPALTLSTLKGMMKEISGSQNEVAIFAYNVSPDQIGSHVTHYESIVGNQVGLNSRMFDSASHGPLVRGVLPVALRDVVQDAEMEIFYPDGHMERVQMLDDGLHFDGAANDGQYGAQIIPSQAGIYRLQAMLTGVNTQGAPFVRTTEHMVNVVEPSISLTGKAKASVHLKENRLSIAMQVTGKAASSQYRTFAEIYGRDLRGAEVPVAWASMTSPVQESENGDLTLPLEVDLHWFAKARAVGPLTFKNVYLQDMESLVPLSELSSVSVDTPASVDAFINSTVMQILSSGYNGTVTKVMLAGHPPASLLKARNATNSGKLLALHGYCAAANPWAKSPDDFTDTVYFLDPSQARTNAVFTQLVVDWAAAQGIESYGVLGYSQGGMIAVNILNSFHTGVDAAVGARKIQSLATPFLGGTASIDGDLLKDIFGAGCGSAYDLSADGAGLWMASITAATKAELNYYTTQYDKGGLFGNGYCNMLMNTVISNPNDGAVEYSRSQVTGAINRGHTLGQCHLEDMNWPAAYFDHTRNAEINANAAR